MHAKDWVLVIFFGAIALAFILYFGGFLYARYDSNRFSGGRKHYKNKFVEKSCMPINLNLILALIFAYIVYTMFYNY